MQRAVSERFTLNDVIKLSTSYDFCATLKKTTQMASLVAIERVKWMMCAKFVSKPKEDFYLRFVG
jgi:hypothetical protein